MSGLFLNKVRNWENVKHACVLMGKIQWKWTIGGVGEIGEFLMQLLVGSYAQNRI